MSTQEVRATEPADVVTVNLTQKEAQYLLRRCSQAWAVLRSNLSYEETRRGPTYHELVVENADLVELMKKLRDSLVKEETE